MWLQAAQVAYAAAHRGAGQQEVLGLFRVTEERSTPTNPHPMVVRRASVQPRRTWRSARAVRPASAERTLAKWKSRSSAKEKSDGKNFCNRAGGEYWNFSFLSLSYYRYNPELRVSRKNRSALEDADDDDCADSGEFVIFLWRITINRVELLLFRNRLHATRGRT